MTEVSSVLLLLTGREQLDNIMSSGYIFFSLSAQKGSNKSLIAGH